MTADQAAAFAVLAGALVLFVWGRLRYDLVALLALLACVVVGIVPAEHAFDGFASPATVTVLLVLVLGRALSTTGAVELVTGRIVRAVRSDSLHVATMSGLGADGLDPES
jgi:di/tricarboxylate transporter